MERLKSSCHSVAVITFIVFCSVFVWSWSPDVSGTDHKRLELIASVTPTASPAVAGRLERIKILRHDPETELTEQTFEAAGRSTFDRDLELGESIENQIISLDRSAGDTRAFRVEQQFETSMAIGDEGPHIDLVNWKHYTADWKAIEKVGENRFLTARIPEADTQRFPSVTAQEIHQVISKAGGKRWGDLARQCKTPFVGPCYVGLSRISFRISANENGVWKEIHRINFSIPLGC